jgi:hypothetical protein
MSKKRTNGEGSISKTQKRHIHGPIHGAYVQRTEAEVPLRTIADLEAGKRGAYRSTLKKLARALKVKPHEQLMKGE